MKSDTPNKFLLLVVTVSFLSIVFTIVQLFGRAGFIGIVVALAVSVLAILVSQRL